LQARDSRVSFNKEEFEGVMELINKAIALDPTFSKAYAFKAGLWFQLSSFGLPQKAWEDSVFLNTSKSISMDPQSSDGYLVQAWVHRFLGNLSEAKNNMKIAYRLNPNDLDVQRNYGYELLNDGDERGADMVLKSIERNYSTKQTEYYQSFVGPLVDIDDYEGAIKMVSEAIKLGAKSSDYDNFFYNVYTRMGRYDEALSAAEKFFKANSKLHYAIDRLAWAYFRKKDYKKAAEYWSKYQEIEAGFDDKTQTVPFRHRLAMALMKLGDLEKVKELLLEDTKIQNQMLEKTRGAGVWNGVGSNYYDLAIGKALLGAEKEAVQYLDSAYKYDFRVKEYFGNDPAFEKIKSLPSFRKVQEKLDSYHAFRKKAFTNAFNRAKASKELKGVMEK
jgi:tetratricopeptide (TPR) repeat protein